MIQHQKCFVLVIVCLLVVQIFGASLLTRRALTQEEENDDILEICQKSTPCGWAVYTRYTRVVDYFMKNKCECPEKTTCVRTDDDISVAAYVYRCVEPNANSSSSTNS